MTSYIEYLRKYKQLVAIAVATVVLASIFAPLQNATAFTLAVSIPPNVEKSSKGTPFSVGLNVKPGELISISTLTVLIDGGTPEQKKFVFDSTGKRISGKPSAMIRSLEVMAPTTTKGLGVGYGLVSSGPVGSALPVMDGALGDGRTKQIKGYVGPDTITFSGKIKTSLLSKGTQATKHTIEVSIDTKAAKTNQHLRSDKYTFVVDPKSTRQTISQIALQISSGTGSDSQQVKQIIEQIALQSEKKGKNIDETVSQLATQVASNPDGLVSQSISQLAKQQSTGSKFTIDMAISQIAQQVSTGNNVTQSVVQVAAQQAGK
jgi:hypothetical protein